MFMKEMTENTEIAKIVKRECKRLGIIQKEFAQRCGISSAMVSNYCRGVNTPSVKVVKTMERQLGLEEGTIEKVVVRKRLDPSSYAATKREREILAAWDRGRLTPKEVAKVTGYSLRIIGRYLPLDED